MKEELTTAMHGEFTVSPDTQLKHQAFAVFALLAAGAKLTNALYGMGITLEVLRTYLPEWTALTGNQITIDD